MGMRLRHLGGSYQFKEVWDDPGHTLHYLL